MSKTVLLVDVLHNNVLTVSLGVHRLQWLSIQENGLHPASFSAAGQSFFHRMAFDIEMFAPTFACL